jgi:flavin-binding protein dodecin
MSVAKTIEITATSKKGFDDAMRSGLKTAGKTLKNITGAWV